MENSENGLRCCKVWRIPMLVLKLGILVVLLVGCIRPPKESDLVSALKEDESAFTEIRDLILEEANLSSIGYDNVGDFWLSGDSWVNHKPPYKKYTEQEMLDLAGLLSTRYEQYLNLLGSVGGYRVSKELSEGRVVIHMFKSGRVSSGTALNIVYYSSAPVFLSNAKYTEIGNGWYVESIGN